MVSIATGSVVQCFSSSDVTSRKRESIVSTGVPHLAAWPLSGIDADQKAFHQQLLSWSQHHGDPSQLHNYESLFRKWNS